MHTGRIATLVVAAALTAGCTGSPARSEGPSKDGVSTAAVGGKAVVSYHFSGTAAAATYTVDLPGWTSQGETILPIPVEPAWRGRVARSEPISVSVQNAGRRGTVSCQLLVDGVVVAEDTASGAHGQATCETTT